MERAAGFTEAAAVSTTKKKLRICPTCQGLRIEKVSYNHVVLDRTCTKCDGEGVLTASEPRVVLPSNTVQSA